MILRRLFCSALALAFAVLCFAQQTVAESDTLLSAEVLKATLYAKTADERQFCDYVIQQRNSGIIPDRLLYGVYRNAMTKDRGRRFAYFKSGLEILCKREGIVLNPMPTTTVPTTSSSAPFWIPSTLKGLFQRG